MKIEELRMIDVTGPQQVHIQLDEGGKTLWVNVDGVCVLRVSQNKLNPSPFKVQLDGFEAFEP